MKILRDDDTSDGRRVVLSLTKAGQRELKKKRSARTEQIARAVAGGFTRAERDTLSAAAPLIERLAELL